MEQNRVENSVWIVFSETEDSIVYVCVPKF